MDIMCNAWNKQKMHTKFGFGDPKEVVLRRNE
jgi:hypothetical protein